MFPAALQDLRPKKITNVNTSRNLVEVVRSVFPSQLDIFQLQTVLRIRIRIKKGRPDPDQHG